LAILALGERLRRVPAGAPGACDPTRTEPVYRGKVPSPRQVLGIELGERAVTAAESDRYLETVAARSERVISGTLATSGQGRPLKYAIAGRPELLSRAGLAKVRAEAGLLRDPRARLRLRLDLLPLVNEGDSNPWPQERRTG
jgi:hypothetical protein